MSLLTDLRYHRWRMHGTVQYHLLTGYETAETTPNVIFKLGLIKYVFIVTKVKDILNRKNQEAFTAWFLI